MKSMSPNCFARSLSDVPSLSTSRKPSERVAHLLGSLSSGVPDLAERHRQYVLAALKHGR
jgi:hypothetical protein